MAFAEQAAYLREFAHLTHEDIARATGVRVNTVRAWLRHTQRPTGNQADRLAELSAIVERLAQSLEPDAIGTWLRQPLALLDDDKPLDVLARGDHQRVSRVCAALESPVVS